MRLIFTLLFVVCSGQLWAGVVRGRVSDDGGATLPYATIYVEGTTIGVSANGNGDFELSLTPGTYKIICQYMGFKPSSWTATITSNEALTHNFTLKAENLEMKEAVIHASEDPAYGIIRSAIRRRTFHLDQVHSFQTGIYLKGVMRSRSVPGKIMGQKVDKSDLGVDTSGKGIMYLLEEDADYYAQGNKEKTVIHSVRESGNQNGLGFSIFPAVITFYDNDVPIFGKRSRGFISPISDNALQYYKYKLLGEIRDHDQTVFKIQVTQKRSYEPCFNGIIYIVDDEYAIHSLNMTLTKQSGMDMIDTLHIDQLFLPVQKDTWVIKSQVLSVAIKVFGFDVVGSGVTVYNGQRVNEPIPDTIFNNHIISAYDKNATKKDTAYWQNRPIPLADDERRDFVVKDSIAQVQNSPHYKDSIRRKGNRFSPLSWLTNDYTYKSKELKNTYTINPILVAAGDNIVNYNLIEGFNVAPKVNMKFRVDSNSNLFADAAVRYGFSNTHFNAVGRLYYATRDKDLLNKSWIYGVEGGKYVYQYNPDNPVMPWFNTYSALFAREHDLKLYERWDASAFLRRNYGNGFTWFVKASYQQRLPLENSTGYSFSGDGKKEFYDNTPTSLLNAATAWEKHDAVILYGSISYKPGSRYIQFPDYKVALNSDWPRFTLQYQKGVPDLLNSKVNYDKWRFNVQGDLNMKLFGLLKYNLAVGGFLNSAYVSFPDLMHLYGNRGIGYASPYLMSFQFAQYYAFSNKEPLYYEGHVEYHLNGLLSNKIPLLRQARYYLLFGGNAFYGSNNDFYTEAFVGIDNIGWKMVRVLRIDFVQSWDSNGGRNSGVRFGLTVPRFSNTRNNLTHSEW